MKGVEEIADRSAAAAAGFALLAPKDRAATIGAAADALEAARESLVALAGQETGLGAPRLEGELTRTVVQLRLFAEVTSTGEELDVRIDETDPDFVLGPRPDLRRYRVPIGPVLNFAAGNFPFAFSIAGGDTAAALAAGCAVVVKVHPGHPELAALTAEIVDTALEQAGAPADTLQLVTGQEEGVALLRHPHIRAASFTGSTRVGRMLADVAAARPAPIPFYGELGSLNPVFVTDSAVRERGPAIAKGLATSVAGSGGQLCTKPGFVFLPKGHGIEDDLRDALAAVPEHRLLTPGISTAYRELAADTLATAGVDPILVGHSREDEDSLSWVTPTVARISAASLREHRDLVREVFGPFTLLVEYEPGTDLAELAADLFEGNLTAGVHASSGDDIGELLDWMASNAGRVLYGGWPTGVAVTPAQQHGGPWPATTTDTGTSVGTAAISRFQRAVAFQDTPEEFLPEPLQDANPWGVPQRRSRAGMSQLWGAPGGPHPV